MRAIAIGCTWICLAACSTNAIVGPKPTARVVPWQHSEPDRPPDDPIAALTPDDVAEHSWVVPGPIQLELGAIAVGMLGSGRPIEVAAIDRQGNLERVAVRLPHARFSVWIARTHLLSVLTR